MKRKLLMVMLVAFAATGLLWTTGASAFNGKREDNITVAKDEVIDSSFYALGKTIAIGGTIKGDLYCAGQNIEIAGTVEGDVVCAGQDIRISGTVQGNVRLLSAAAVITGKVERSASIAGQTIIIEDSGEIGRDFSVASWMARIGGKVGRDVVSVSQHTTLAGDVGRDVRMMGDTATVQVTAKVEGKVTNVSKKDANVQEGAGLIGGITRESPPNFQFMNFEKPRWVSYLGNPLYWFFVYLALGALLRLLIPRWAKVTTNIMLKRSVTSLGAGLGALILLPVVSVILLFTLIGIPFGMMLTGFWLTAGFMAIGFAVMAMAELASQRLEISWLDQRQLWWAAYILSLIAIILLTRLPAVGGLLGFFASVWGLGGVVLGSIHVIKAQRTPVISKTAK